MIRLAQILMLIAVLSSALGGCLSRGKARNKGQTDPNSALRIVTFDENPFGRSSEVTKRMLEQSLRGLSLSQLDKDRIWSVAHCQCTPNFTGSYLTQLGTTRGVLPQALVPSVREQIRNDPKLKLLMSLPPGTLQSAANFFAGFFLNDDKIADQIRVGLAEKINRAAPGGARIDSHLKFRFDGFPSPVNIQNQNDPKVFDTDVQASRWTMIMAIPNMWNGDAPLAFSDHGLQLLHTSQLMSEWQYLFGLEKSTRGATYGGLTFDPREGLGGRLAPFDPRVDTKGKRVVSGAYTISYSQADQIDLATNVQEKWQRNAGRINLDEQARLWTSAAMAFQRLRPVSRGKVMELFSGAQPLFPTDAHQIALVFLPGIEVLLDGMFIDKQALLVRQYAFTKETSGPEATQPANMVTLARLARAMNLWVEQTRDVGDAGLDANLAKQIRTGHDEFVRVLQLSIQSILSNNVRDSGVKSRLGGMAMVKSSQDFSRPDVAEVAEVLATLTAVEQASLPSPILKQRIIGLHHWFVAEYLAGLPNGQLQEQLSPQAILWTYKAMRLFGRYKEGDHRAPWLRDLTTQLQAAVASWDGGIIK